MKIAWLIQGPFWVSSAYYQQIHLFSNTLHDFGHDSAIANPTSFEQDGEATIEKIKAYEPDVVVAFGDVHPFAFPAQTGIPMMSWFLNGGGPLPPELDSPGVTIASVSRYCQRRIESEIGVNSLYVPHAYDANHFHPGRKAAARHRLGIDVSGFVVAMVGTNYGQEGSYEPGPDRKNWAGGLQAFAEYHKHFPASKLYAHTNATGAIDIQEEVDRLGIADAFYLADQTHFHHGNWDYPPEHVADVYRAADVLLFPSLGEGFGVPIIEAQACGTPVIATTGGPMTELVQSGTCVPSSPHPDKPEWMLPDKDAMVSALSVWTKSYQPTYEISRRVEMFSVEAVVEDYMIPALETACNRSPSVSMS